MWMLPCLGWVSRRPQFSFSLSPPFCSKIPFNHPLLYISCLPVHVLMSRNIFYFLLSRSFTFQPFLSSFPIFILHSSPLIIFPISFPLSLPSCNWSSCQPLSPHWPSSVFHLHQILPPHHISPCHSPNPPLFSFLLFPWLTSFSYSFPCPPPFLFLTFAPLLLPLLPC